MVAKDFYERRSKVALKVENYLIQRTQNADTKTPVVPLREFIWSLVRDEGATDGMIAEMFRRHGLRIENDQLVKA